MQPMPDATPVPETGFDRLLTFTIPDRDCRGRMVRLGPVLDDILAAHEYPPAIKLVLAEALVLTTLLGGLLKDRDDQVTLQAQAKGAVISLLVCDFRNGELRGYLDYDPAEFDMLGAVPDLTDLFGEGFLCITFDLGEQDKRYQGIVPLEGVSLTAALEAYFAQSEQVPTLIRTGLKSGASGNIAGGLLVQHLPAGEEGRARLHALLDHPHWEHVSVLAQTVRTEELIQQDLSLEQLVWRLYNQEEAVLTGQGSPVSKGCRCSIEHFEQVLARFSREDRKDMADDKGIILIDCAFCSRQFPVED
jgi:molecular chaperone Hsp33